MKEATQMLGVMIDMSRNAVMSISGLKRFLPILKKMGYNCVMLYMEDTYEVDAEPYFGYMRGRYTKEEMKEIDAFAASQGITIIPCIQTLAHLNSVFRWGQIPNDCDDILLTDDERSYDLIKRMFATLAECFSSRRIHIGMDEAHMLGRGAHMDIHGSESVYAIMKRHLDRVREIAAVYGYELLVWSDMYFRPWNGGDYMISQRQVPREVVESLPEDVIPVYWDYYQSNEQMYSNMIINHMQLSDKTWFAGGAWCWQGWTPFNRFTLQSMIPAIHACRTHGVRNIIFTMWGDDGAECSHFSQLPSLFYLAQYAKGNTDEEKIKEDFKALFGVDFDDFMEVDCPNNVVEYEGRPRNPSKYMLYSDYFNDFLDYTVRMGYGKRYGDFSKKLHMIAEKSHSFGYVFDCLSKLCDVLEIKYDLGLRTRTAYESGNKVELKRLAENEYVQVEHRIKIFAEAFQAQWMMDNKPHGFDVQDMRLGGLLQRTISCRQRILLYVNDMIDRIDELEEVLLPYGEKEESISMNRALFSATVNSIHMNSTPKFPPVTWQKNKGL